MKETKWKTLIVSDVHLGSKASRSEDLWHFLNDNPSHTLILNGDIVDEWAMRRGAKWQDKHSKVIRKILKIAMYGTYTICASHRSGSKTPAGRHRSRNHRTD